LLLFPFVVWFSSDCKLFKVKNDDFSYFSSVCEEVDVGSDLRYNEDYEGVWICLEIFYIDEN